MSEPKKDRFLGRAVRDGKVMFSSVSQIKLFDPADEGCNRKWAFAYPFQKKLERTGAQEAGTDFAEKLEDYLTTGEDVLPRTLQPAKKFFPSPGPDLECEKYLGDMERAITLRHAWLLEKDVVKRQVIFVEMQLAAGLLAGAVPVDGAADVRHRRGTYIDQNGDLQKEAEGTYVINIDDLKTVSRIYPHTIRKGKNAGMVLPTYCKTDAEVCEDTQMVGYGRHAVNVYPGMTHARLGLIYANREKREAVKRMGIISVEQILTRWRRVEDVVAKMEQVATAQRIEDIEPNVRACDSYTHVDPADPTGSRVLKGCGHRYYCPLSISESVPHMLGQYKESAMSLFDQVPAPPVPSVPQTPAAPFDPAAHAAEVEAEKRRLQSQDDARHPCAVCGASLTANDISRLPSGAVKHIGCPGSVVAPPPPPTAPAPPISVNPPDQPRAPGMLELAAPVPPGEIAQITDPELRARVEEHARQHATLAAQEAARLEQEKVAAGAVVWCPTSAQKIVITAEMAVARKFLCTCGKNYSMSALKPIKENDQLVSVIPRHKLPKKEGEATTPPPPAVDRPHIVVRGEGGEEIAPEVPPAPPAPPAPPVIVESGRTSYDDALLANPPRTADALPVPPAPPAPPPSAPPVEATAANGHANGHTNGHGVEQRMSRLTNFGLPGARAFKTTIHVVRQDGATTTQEMLDCIIVAFSMKEAMTKGETLGEIVAIELLPGPVLS